MKKEITIDLDEDLIRECEELAEEKNLDPSALVRKVLIEGLERERLNFAIQRYIMKEISIERAAELAKISLHELILRMTHLGIPSNVTLEDYQKILE